MSKHSIYIVTCYKNKKRGEQSGSLKAGEHLLPVLCRSSSVNFENCEALSLRKRAGLSNGNLVSLTETEAR